MFYIVYETTNTANSKTYIGVHRSETLDDNYLGSGLAIRRAVKKYGRHHFVRKNLAVFDSSEPMLWVEQLLVNPDWVKSSANYNMRVGGDGYEGSGFAAINTSGSNNKAGQCHITRMKLASNTEYAVEFSNRIKAGLRKKFPDGRPGNKGMLGRTVSEETRKKLSEATKRRYSVNYLSESY